MNWNEGADISYYNSRLDIDLDAVSRNLEKIKSYTGGLEILPVIKSNAYGLGTVEIARHLVKSCGILLLAVARIFEA